MVVSGLRRSQQSLNSGMQRKKNTMLVGSIKFQCVRATHCLKHQHVKQTFCSYLTWCLGLKLIKALTHGRYPSCNPSSVTCLPPFSTTTLPCSRPRWPEPTCEANQMWNVVFVCCWELPLLDQLLACVVIQFVIATLGSVPHQKVNRYVCTNVVLSL